MFVPKIFVITAWDEIFLLLNKYFWCLSETIMADFTVEYERESCIRGHHILTAAYTLDNQVSFHWRYVV